MEMIKAWTTEAWKMTTNKTKTASTWTEIPENAEDEPFRKGAKSFPTRAKFGQQRFLNWNVT